MTREQRKQYTDLYGKFKRYNNNLVERGIDPMTRADFIADAKVLVSLGSPKEKNWDYINRIANAQLEKAAEQSEIQILMDSFFKAYRSYRASGGADVSQIDPTYSGGMTSQQRMFADYDESEVQRIARELIEHKDYDKSNKYAELIERMAK